MRLSSPLHPAVHGRRHAHRAAALLHTARQVVVVTGAGISAASGIATYRSDGSRWDDQQLEAMMRAGTYREHLPQLWRHWHGLRAQVVAATPNPAHVALVDWDRRLQASGGSLTVVTQNPV